jgi:transposase
MVRASEMVAELEVVGGVDTHKDVHAAAALSDTGRLLGTAVFPTTPMGYRQLLTWWQGFGQLHLVGMEGTGSYGASLCRFLIGEGVEVLEVVHPKRQVRRFRGKSDPLDAEIAARVALSGEAAGQPKAQNGTVEAIRVLRVARRSAMKARTQAANQLHAIVETAPAELREKLRNFRLPELVTAARRFRRVVPSTPVTAARFALRGLAERWAALDAEIQHLDAQLADLVAAVAPRLLRLSGVGTDTAGALLVAAGDNPRRLTSEAAFAALCGASPVDASSGRQHRHRLNRGGDREANRALWVVGMVRMAKDPRTRHYVARRTQEGLSSKEILRCLKRYIAREVYRALLLDGRVAGTLVAATVVDEP